MIKNHYKNIRIFSHEETGNWQTYQRDLKIQKWCKKNDITLQEYHSNGVVRRLADRNQWSKIWNMRMNKDIFQPTQIQTQVELSETLSALSKKTKEYYAKYFQNNYNPHLQK